MGTRISFRAGLEFMNGEREEIQRDTIVQFFPLLKLFPWREEKPPTTRLTFVSTISWVLSSTLKLDLFMMRSRDVEWASYDDELCVGWRQSNPWDFSHISRESGVGRFSLLLDWEDWSALILIYFAALAKSMETVGATQQECFEWNSS